MELKKCTKCGEEKEATSEFFCRSKTGKNGFRADCKKCKNAKKGIDASLFANCMKKCNKCKEEKTASEFYKSKEGKYGVTSTCKKCHCVATRIWQKNNPEKVIKSQRLYDKKNLEKNSKRMSIWRENNYERNIQNARQWTKNNPDKIKQYSKKQAVNLSDSMVRSIIRINKEDCPPELIEVKRLQLKIKRLCKTSKN